MTTQATTVQRSKGGPRVLIAAGALALAVLGGAALWQMRSGGEAGASRATTAAVALPAVRSATDGVVPLGGMAELYRDQARVAVAVTDGVRPLGGMAELYRDQAREA